MHFFPCQISKLAIMLESNDALLLVDTSDSFKKITTKGQIFSKCFWYLQFFRKTNELNYYGTSSRIVFVRFLEELKTPKSPFEINWPLKLCIFFRTSQSLLCCPKLMCGDMAWTEGSTFSFLLTPFTENSYIRESEKYIHCTVLQCTLVKQCLLKNGIYALCNIFWQSFNKQNAL